MLIADGIIICSSSASHLVINSCQNILPLRNSVHCWDNMLRCSSFNNVPSKCMFWKTKKRLSSLNSIKITAYLVEIRQILGNGGRWVVRKSFSEARVSCFPRSNSSWAGKSENISRSRVEREKQKTFVGGLSLSFFLLFLDTRTRMQAIRVTLAGPRESDPASREAAPAAAAAYWKMHSARPCRKIASAAPICVCLSVSVCCCCWTDILSFFFPLNEVGEQAKADGDRFQQLHRPALPCPALARSGAACPKPVRSFYRLDFLFLPAFIFAKDFHLRRRTAPQKKMSGYRNLEKPGWIDWYFPFWVSVEYFGR